MRKIWLVAGLVGTALALSACSNGPTSPQDDQREVSSVVPRDGSSGVSPSAPIVLDFTHTMQAGMEKYLVLHEGDADGAAVAGQWTWSADYRKLTFVPASPLKSQTKYTIHMGMGMMDANGAMIGDHAQHHGSSEGGHMGGGMMGETSGSMMGSDMSQCVMLTSFTTA